DESQRLTIGAAAASRRIKSTFTPRGDVERGRSRRTVSNALALISAPGMSLLRDAEVGCTSWSDGAVGPTMATLPLKVPGAHPPASRSENETDRTCPGGPVKSIGVPLPGKLDRGT